MSKQKRNNKYQSMPYRRMISNERQIKKHEKMKKRIFIFVIIWFLLLLSIIILLVNRPVIILKGDSIISIPMGEKYQDQGAEVRTFRGHIKNIKHEGTVNFNKAGTYKLTYQVPYLNSKIRKYRIVKVVDKEAPVITLNGKSVLYLEENSEYEEAGYTALDNNDGDISDKVIVKNKVNMSKVGTYKIEYQVSDKASNKATLVRTVVVVKKADPNLKTIYLTFDDGPSPVTNKVLDILKKENIKATFFTIGKPNEYNDILKRIASEGHTLAIHSNTHNYRYIYQSVDVYFKDLYELRDRLKSITGESSNIIRFPGGSSNTVSSFNPGIMSTLTAEVVRRGFYYFDWNVDSGDTGRIGSDAIVKNVTESLGDYHTYIVLMHDYGLNQQTADSLERIIQYGKNHGYRFDKITADTPAVHHGINN